MFKAYIPSKCMVVTVLAVDFNHDAFLVAVNNHFKWMSMDEFTPYDE